MPDLCVGALSEELFECFVCRAAEVSGTSVVAVHQQYSLLVYVCFSVRWNGRHEYGEYSLCDESFSNLAHTSVAMLCFDQRSYAYGLETIKNAS